jgi:D-lactate dehydrogenase
MKVVFFEVKEKEREFLPSLLDGFNFHLYSEKLSEETAGLASGAEVVSVFVDSEINKNIIDLLEDTKFICTRSTGFDHIDRAYAKEKGILVSNVPSYGSRTVAEFTFALLLCLSRKIFQARHQTLISENLEDIESFQGVDMFRKTIGVVGTGKIGKNVIKIAKGFGMNVIAFDVRPDKEFASDEKFEYVSLEELLANSDVVTLHTPYMKETHHLINSSNIFKIKKGAFLINTARGELVETDALLKALVENHIAGAGLDVLESERQLKEEAELLSNSAEKIKDFKTLLQNHVLINMPQVVITPHIAFFSKEAVEEILKVTIQNIRSFISGDPENLV